MYEATSSYPEKWQQLDTQWTLKQKLIVTAGASISSPVHAPCERKRHVCSVSSLGPVCLHSLALGRNSKSCPSGMLTWRVLWEEHDNLLNDDSRPLLNGTELLRTHEPFIMTQTLLTVPSETINIVVVYCNYCSRWSSTIVPKHEHYVTVHGLYSHSRACAELMNWIHQNMMYPSSV